MDLEWAEKADQPLGHYDLKRVNTPPEVLNGGVWTAAADMWQFGRVLESWGGLSPLGQQLSASLPAETPEDRPTAEQALNHQYFALAIE